MKTLIALGILLTTTVAYAQILPWSVRNVDGWFIAIKPGYNDDTLTFACDPKDPTKLMLAYTPKSPVSGQNSRAVEFMFDESVPAGRWQIEQGTLVTRNHNTILRLMDKVSETSLFTVDFERLPTATFDDAGFPEMARSLAKTCGR